MKLVRVEHIISVTPETAQLLKELFKTDISSFLKNISMNIKDIQDKIAELTQQVAAETEVEKSAITLISGFGTTLAGLKQQLADALAANDPVAIQAVVDSITAVETTLSTSSADLAAAVTANITPAV